MHQHQLYFWTTILNGWKHLLAAESMKMEVIQALQWLTTKELVRIYAYVVMPDYIHLIWETHKKNGKKGPHHSLLKFSAQLFKTTDCKAARLASGV